MPRFFFDLTTDEQLSRDLEGILLPNVAAARAEAAQCLGEMIRCSSAGASPERWGMSVRDEAGQAVVRASYRMEITAEA